jgi:Ca-activated chloride channel family protein
MRFAQPEVLWWLLALPGLVWVLYYGAKRRHLFLQQFGDMNVLVPTAARLPSLQKPWILGALAGLPLVCVVFALSDPRYPTGRSYMPDGSLDVVMVIDVSKSMAAEDYGATSRLDMAREMARHMLTELGGNRVGLITYAGISFRQADLTTDFEALDFILEQWVSIDAVRIGGSNLKEAVETGLEVFDQEARREKLMLVFSDGGTEHEGFAPTLDKAAQHGVKIVALGLGQEQPSRIPLYDANKTFQGYLKEEGESGRVITSRLNEKALTQVASGARGTYIHIERGQEWRHLLRRHDVAGSLFVQDERKIYQSFLLAGLFTFAGQILVQRI